MSPEWSVEDKTPPEFDSEKHGNFNLILDHTYRIDSRNAHEVFRVRGTGRTYSLGNTWDITNNHEFKRCWDFYIKGETKYHFIVRVFKTEKGRYFMQCIMGDGSVFYQIMELAKVQRLVESWESGDKTYPEEPGRFDYVPKPGKYKVIEGTIEFRNENNMSISKCHEIIDSLEVIDKNSYDGVFEEL